MKNQNIFTKGKVTAVLAAILFISLGASFKTPKNLPKRNDTVAYHRALSELEMHMLRADVLDTDIEEYIKIFDAYLESARQVDAKKSTLEADRAKNRTKVVKPILNAENGWYFLFD